MSFRLPRAGIYALMLAAAVAAPRAQLYSGAELRTKEAYVNGRFEVRMRSTAGIGMLCSFFSFSDVSGSQWNEIDMEILGRYINEVQFNHITGPVAAQHSHPWRYPMPFNPHQDFHTYAFEWKPDTVIFYVEGKAIYRTSVEVRSNLTFPAKMMMNIWASSDAAWVGAFNRSILPVYAYYDWVSYSAYTPKAGPGGSDFTLRWKEDFNTFDANRWERASHTFANNLAKFHPSNSVIQGGLLILCLTEMGQEGFRGTLPSTVIPMRGPMRAQPGTGWDGGFGRGGQWFRPDGKWIWEVATDGH